MTNFMKSKIVKRTQDGKGFTYCCSLAEMLNLHLLLWASGCDVCKCVIMVAGCCRKTLPWINEDGAMQPDQYGGVEPVLWQSAPLSANDDWLTDTEIKKVTGSTFMHLQIILTFLSWCRNSRDMIMCVKCSLAHNRAQIIWHFFWN